MQLDLDVRLALLAAGLTLLVGLLTGALKYAQILRSPEGHAHVYTDIAHRASLLYSFALTTIAALIAFSRWSVAAHLAALAVLLVYFWGSIASYVVHGIRQDTDNQLRSPDLLVRTFMATLVVGEVGALAFLLAGFVAGQF